MPHNAMLHVKINGLSGVTAPNRIAKSVNVLSITMISSSQNVNLSSIIMCNDRFNGLQMFHCYG